MAVISYAKITQSGKLTVAKSAKDYVPPVPEGHSKEDYISTVCIHVVAKTTDGTNKEDLRYIYFAPEVRTVNWFIRLGNWKEGDPVDWHSGNGSQYMGKYEIDPKTGYSAGYNEWLYVYSDETIYGGYSDLYQVSSGSPAVICFDGGEATEFGGKKCVRYPIEVHKLKIGKSEKDTVKVKANINVNDGSGKKIVITMEALGVEKKPD